jgi:hypothetical protein
MIENFQQHGSGNFIPYTIVSGLTYNGSALVDIWLERENQVPEVISKRVTTNTHRITHRILNWGG